MVSTLRLWRTAELALGGFVLVVIILLNRSNTPTDTPVGDHHRPRSRQSGSVVQWKADSSFRWRPALISVPVPFRFGFAFDWTAFLPVALIYLISTIETVGDLTANCMLAKSP